MLPGNLLRPIPLVWKGSAMTLHADPLSPALESVFEGEPDDLTATGQAWPDMARPEEIITQMVEQIRAKVSCDGIAALYENRFLTSINIEVCPLPRCLQPDHLHLNEGPCRYALDQGEPIRITDTKWSLRWPQWSKRVAKQGFRSTLSVAVRSKTHRYASLTLFNRAPGAFTPFHIAAVTPLIDSAVLALSATHSVSEGGGSSRDEFATIA